MILRKLFYREFKTVDQLWRLRTLFSAINEFFNFQIISSDENGYKLPLCHNWFHAASQQREWSDTDTMYYERHDDGENAVAVFNFGIDLIKDRIQKDAKILDVGCNTGLWLQHLYDLGYSNLWGIDPQKSAVKFAEKERPYLNIKEGFFGPKQFDIECDVLYFADRFFVSLINLDCLMRSIVVAGNTSL